jgi:hypothetical protein
MRVSVVKPPSFCHRSSELPPERPPPEQGGRGGGADHEHFVRTYVSLPSHWPVREQSGLARPPSIRGDARSHTSCTHALDRRARRSICKTVPAGTRRAIERRAPVWADGARPSVGYRVTDRCAPSGTTPCSTNRHNAITSFRATATIPIRRLRPPAAANRRVNHCASALSGCQRSQHHAS